MARDGKPRRALSTEEWLTVRAEWERSGESLKVLAQKWGVAIETITKRKKAQQWRRDPTDEVQRRTVKKVAEKTAAAAIGSTVGPGDGNSHQVELPGLPVALTPEEVIEKTAEERADVIMRHQREWREFTAIRLAAIEVFYRPEIRLKTTTTGDTTIVEEIRDYSKIEMAKKLADTLLVQHRGERAAHSLDHNLNVTKAQDIAKRDEMIRETFSAFREAAKKLRSAVDAESKTIDVTPNKESKT